MGMRRTIIIACCCIVAAAVSVRAATLSNSQNLVVLSSKDVDFRFKRQSNATTDKPRKNRPSNIFSLISVLISETRNDTSRAFNEIGNLFNSQFSENTPVPEKHQATSTEPTTEFDEDNEITTTTEPYRITREEFFGILRSNVQGLMRLFQKELGNALRDSRKNARQFGQEFRNAITPYVT